MARLAAIYITAQRATFRVPLPSGLIVAREIMLFYELNNMATFFIGREQRMLQLLSFGARSKHDFLDDAIILTGNS